MVPWRARKAVIKLALASSVSISTAAALDTFFSSGTVITAKIKNVEIALPEGDVSQQDYVGEDANGFQNAELDEKPFGMAVLTATIDLPQDELIETFAMGSGTAINGTHTRYRVGDGNRPECAALVNMDDTKELNFVLDDALFTLVGPVKLSGPDGHWEQDFKIICLCSDFHGPEFKD